MSETNQKTCRCNSAPTNHSGAGAFYPSQYSDDYEVHYSYSNWDEYCVFTCNTCGTNWLLDSMYTDRPPYICNATRLNDVQFSRIKALSVQRINELVQQNPIHALEKIANGDL